MSVVKNFPITANQKNDFLQKLTVIFKASVDYQSRLSIGKALKSLDFDPEAWYGLEGRKGSSSISEYAEWNALDDQDQKDAYIYLTDLIKERYDKAHNFLEIKEKSWRLTLLKNLKQKVQDECLYEDPIEVETLQGLMKTAGFEFKDFFDLLEGAHVSKKEMKKQWDKKSVNVEGKERALKNLENIAKPDNKYLAEQQAVIDSFNAKYLILSLGGKTVIVDKERFPEGEIRDYHNFCLMLSDQVVHLSKKKTMKKAEFWFNSPLANRKTDGIIFDPSGQADSNPQLFNLWKGFSYQPENNGKEKPFLNYTKEVICQGDESSNQYLIACLADIVQHPTKKNGKAIALRGKQGTGKTFFVEQFGKLFGDAFLKTNRAQDIGSRFNARMANKLVVFCDENFSFWAGPEGHQITSYLKNIITGDTIDVEFKGKDSIIQKNYMRIFLATNDDWVAPVEKNDRRYIVLDVSDKHRNDHAYFAAIQDSLENGGYSGLLYCLLHFDLSKIDFDRDAPITRGKIDNYFEQDGGIDEWIKDVILSNWDRSEIKISTDAFFQKFIDDTGLIGMKKVKFGREMKARFPKSIRKTRSRVKRSTNTYTISNDMPNLEYEYVIDFNALKEELVEHIGFPIDWESELREYEGINEEDGKNHIRCA